MPQNGAIVWVNSRYLTYRGQSAEGLAEDPWASIHPDDRDEYLRAWSRSVRTGDQFSRTVRIRRFDGAYRWFQARAVASRDRRNAITQFLGSYMDIHDQHIAELKAARQEEIEASDAKHRLLANLIPQIIFTATEDEGITFANDQWPWYSGQSFDDSLGLGFLDFVHPEDLERCRIPSLGRAVLAATATKEETAGTPMPESADFRIARQALSRGSSSASGSSESFKPTDPTGAGRAGQEGRHQGHDGQQRSALVHDRAPAALRVWRVPLAPDPLRRDRHDRLWKRRQLLLRRGHRHQRPQAAGSQAEGGYGLQGPVPEQHVARDPHAAHRHIGHGKLPAGHDTERGAARLHQHDPRPAPTACC